jgi:hypothetical protein
MPVLMLCPLLQVHPQCITTGWQLRHCWSCCVHGKYFSLLFSSLSLSLQSDAASNSTSKSRCLLHLQAYYTSFASVAFVVYFLRTRKGYRSLPEAIHDRHAAAYSIVPSSSELRASYISLAMLEPESSPNPC